MNILQKTVSNLVVVFFLFSLKMINGYFSLIISGRIFFCFADLVLPLSRQKKGPTDSKIHGNSMLCVPGEWCR